MRLISKIFVCACDKGGIIRYTKFECDIMDRKGDPDIILSEKLTENRFRPNDTGHCAHSNSFRYEGGKTVLTYLVWSAVDQLGLFPTNFLPQDKATIPSTTDRLKPKPVETNETSVLSHGLRQFRFLMDQKEATILDANFTIDIEASIGRLEPAVAGRID